MKNRFSFYITTYLNHVVSTSRKIIPFDCFFILNSRRYLYVNGIFRNHYFVKIIFFSVYKTSSLHIPKKKHFVTLTIYRDNYQNYWLHQNVLPFSSILTIVMYFRFIFHVCILYFYIFHQEKVFVILRKVLSISQKKLFLFLTYSNFCIFLFPILNN